VLKALQCLHALLILHRDIKPDNVLVTSDGAARLADFGIAASVASPTDKRHSVIGTSHYLSPEAIMSVGYDFKVDVWSLGLTLIELLDRQHPYAGQDAFRVMYLISAAPAPVSLNASPVLADLIAQCLQKRPDARPSATQLLAHAALVDADRLNGLDTRLFEAPSSATAVQSEPIVASWAVPTHPAVQFATPPAVAAAISAAATKLDQPKRVSSARSTRKPRERDAEPAPSVVFVPPSPSMPSSPSPVARDATSNSARERDRRERRDVAKPAASRSKSVRESGKSAVQSSKSTPPEPSTPSPASAAARAQRGQPPPPPPEPVDVPPTLPDYVSDDENDKVVAWTRAAPPPQKNPMPPLLRTRMTSPEQLSRSPPRSPPMKSAVGSPQDELRPPSFSEPLSGSRRRFGTVSTEPVAPAPDDDAAPIRFDRSHAPHQLLSSSRDFSSRPHGAADGVVDARPALLMALAKRGLPAPAPSEVHFALRQAAGDPEVAADIVERMRGRAADAHTLERRDSHTLLLGDLRRGGLPSAVSARRISLSTDEMPPLPPLPPLPADPAPLSPPTSPSTRERPVPPPAGHRAAAPPLAMSPLMRFAQSTSSPPPVAPPKSTTPPPRERSSMSVLEDGGVDDAPPVRYATTSFAEHARAAVAARTVAAVPPPRRKPPPPPKIGKT
jgi:serine/threonine protein kinase